MVFALCLRGEKKLTKQTNKTATRLAKRSFKTESKIHFNVIAGFRE